MTLDLATLGASGITGAQLVTTSEGADTLTLATAEDLDAADLIDLFEQVILTASGATRFIGWLDQAPKAASGSSRSRSYTLAGPMRWLDRTPWTNSTGGGRAELSQVDGNILQPLDTTIRAILDFVIAAQPGTVAYVDADLDIAVLQTAIPPETRLDSNCGALLRRALKFVPTVIFWWDYTAATPTIRFADADKTTADKSLSESLYDLSQASFSPRADLLYNTVRIFWTQDGILARTDEVTATSGDAFSIVSGNAAAARALVQTFELGRYNIPSEGIAAAILKHCSRLHVDASATMVGLDWTHRPGLLWAFAGLLASSYKSFGYQVARDLLQLTQTLSLGVPPSFAAYSLSDGNGDNGGPPKDPAASGHPFQGIDVTEPGSATKLLRVIYGTVQGIAPTGTPGMVFGDEPACIFTASGSKVVYVCVTIDADDGSVTARTIAQATSMPSDGATTFYYQLLSYTISSGRLYISQSVAGSLAFHACPFWYSNPRSWTPSWGPV